MLVYRQMRAFTGPHRDLEDLAQSALEQILRSDFHGRSKLSTFTHSVCYHVWLKHLRFTFRFRARFVPLDDEQHWGEVDERDPASLLDDRRRLERLYTALNQVSLKRRAVVTLHDITGLEIAEIVEVVGAKEATVRTRLRDGRKKLRSLLANDPVFQGRPATSHVEPTPQELPCPQN